MIEKKYTGIAKQGADVVANPTLDGSEKALNSIRINGENFKIEGGTEVVANGTYDDYAEPLERIEIDGKKYTTLNKKKVEYVTAHFEEGVFNHTLQDIADSELPVFITNLTSKIEFELRYVRSDNSSNFVLIVDGDIMNSAADYFDSLGIGGCYERNENYLDFIEDICCSEGDELKIEYYNHQSSTYKEM